MTARADFWQDKSKAAKISQKLADLKQELERLADLEKEIRDLAEMEKELGQDAAVAGELEQKAAALEKSLEKEEINTFMAGRYDANNALLEIMAGAGGQDSQDWATLLWRMYQRYIEGRGWKQEILEQSFGEAGGPEGRVGTKSVTLEVKGFRSYGFLKGEAGVHRLVRLSPFSSQHRRHTSFAKLEVTPLIEDEKEVAVRPEDLKIEFYRASGPGGQNVNKVESSVRLTHLPTGIIVACQTERLQSSNRQKAMQMLISKLVQRQESERQKEMTALRGEKKSASWSNQIRNYVLHPYKLVKDLRTNVESSNPEAVLDGQLDEFIEAELRLGK